jgi:hypothetical protein
VSSGAPLNWLTISSNLPAGGGPPRTARAEQNQATAATDNPTDTPPVGRNRLTPNSHARSHRPLARYGAIERARFASGLRYIRTGLVLFRR